MIHAAFIAVVSGLVAVGSVSSGQNTQAADTLASRTSGLGGSVDTTASAYIAANVATTFDLAISEEVKEQTQAIKTQNVFAMASDDYLSKNSTVATDAATRRDIETYIVKSDDSVASIAKQFDITSDTLRWANGLGPYDEVSAGQRLKVLPINGVLHTVAEGDTPKSLAQRFKANGDQILSFNDAELTGLKPGQTIIIPDGTKPAVQSVGPTISNAYSAGFVPTHQGNGYSYGYCTWYVATQIKIPSNWGNATTWDDYARFSGYTVSDTPRVGAIAQNDWMAGGLGHVAVVEKVDGNRVYISDMNGFAGWGTVGTGWAPASLYKYIY